MGRSISAPSSLTLFEVALFATHGFVLLDNLKEKRRAFLFTLPLRESGSQARRGPSPAATATDPPASGRENSNCATSKLTRRVAEISQLQKSKRGTGPSLTERLVKSLASILS